MMENSNHQHWGTDAESELCFNCSIPMWDEDDIPLNYLMKSQFEDDNSRRATSHEVPSLSASHSFYTSGGFDGNKKVTEIVIIDSSRSPTTTTKVSVSDALSSIFKLEYLNCFNHVEPQRSEEELSLCQSCSEILNQLYSLYNSFLQLQKVDSSLANKIKNLDEIIDRHQQRDIDCDLICGAVSQKNKSCHTTTTTATVAKKTKKSTTNDGKTESSSSIIIVDRDPHVMLTRLVLSQQQQQQIARIKKERIDDIVVVESPLDDDDDDYVALDDFDDALFIKSEPDQPDNEFTTASNTIVKTDNVVTTLKRKGETSQRVSEESKKSKSISGPSVSSSLIKLSNEVPNPSVHQEVDDGSSSSSSSDADEVVVDTKKTLIQNNAVKKQMWRRKTRMTAASKRVRAPNKHPLYKARRTKVANPCWYCDQDFPSPDLLFKHTEEEHLPDNRRRPRSAKFHICPRCSKLCCGQRRLRDHLKKCESVPSGIVLPSPFHCPECSKGFTTSSNLKSHMIVHSNDRPFACDRCLFQGKSANALNLHTKNVHNDDDEAGVDTSVKCDECDRVLKNQRRLEKHKFNHHSDLGRQRYQAAKEQYLAKKRVETKQRQSVSTCTVCYECNVDFFTHLSLVVHQKSCHLDQLLSMSICELCGKSFTKAEGLKRHLKRAHGDDRPYLCPQCGKGFKTSQNLYTHESQIHTIEGKLKYSAYMRDLKRRKKQLETQFTGGPPQPLLTD